MGREIVSLRQAYKVARAGDGLSALQLRAAQTPDLIILDWMPPKLDGLEVLRRIRRTSAVPVLTARGEETDRVVGLEVGAVAMSYLQL